MQIMPLIVKHAFKPNSFSLATSPAEKLTVARAINEGIMSLSDADTKPHHCHHSLAAYDSLASLPW